MSSEVRRKIVERGLPAMFISLGVILAPVANGWTTGVLYLGVLWALDGIHNAIERRAPDEQ